MRWLFLVLVFTSGCSGLFYQPAKDHAVYFQPENEKEDDAVKVPEEVWIASDYEGAPKLNAWYFHGNKKKASPKKPVIVHFHGNAENISTHFMSMVWAVAEGYDYLIFDYQGYGKSEGSPGQKETVLDGMAAIRYMAKRNPGRKIVVIGQSLGGAVATRSVAALKKEAVAGKRMPNIELLVLDSTFHSYQEVASDMMSRHIITWIMQPLGYILVSDAYAPEDVIADISPIPTVVIHGDQDQVVDVKFGTKVFSLAKDPKEYWPVPGGKHIDCFWKHPQICQKKLTEWLVRLEKKS